MTKQDYDKLNNYLNEIFKILNNYDRFLTKHIEKIARINDAYLIFMSKHNFSEQTVKNNLTYYEVYDLARKIVACISPKYLYLYDSLLPSGKLDFGYDNEYGRSCFECCNSLINVKRSFNYGDVLVLIHEFIHYTNSNTQNSNNRYLLTEFFSIYFELFAVDYLTNMGFFSAEIGVNRRLQFTISDAEALASYEIVFLAYEKFGNITEDTFVDLNRYFLSISDEDFESDCKNLLENLEQKENDYRQKIRYEKPFEFGEFIDVLPFFDNYRYLLGTLLAFYARENFKIEDVVYLNDHINDDNLGNLKMSDLLKRLGVDINSSDFITKALDGIDNYIKKYNNEKSR